VSIASTTISTWHPPLQPGKGSTPIDIFTKKDGDGYAYAVWSYDSIVAEGRASGTRGDVHAAARAHLDAIGFGARKA
jgi:hypothetical protein